MKKKLFKMLQDYNCRWNILIAIFTISLGIILYVLNIKVLLMYIFAILLTAAVCFIGGLIDKLLTYLGDKYGE